MNHHPLMSKFLKNSGFDDLGFGRSIFDNDSFFGSRSEKQHNNEFDCFYQSTSHGMLVDTQLCNHIVQRLLLIKTARE